MKFLLAFILTFVGIFAGAQTTGKNLEFNSAWGVDYNPNAFPNPSARKNTVGINSVGYGATRSTNATHYLADNYSSFAFTTTANGQYVNFILNTFIDDQKSGNCVWTFNYATVSPNFSVVIYDGVATANATEIVYLTPTADTKTKQSVRIPVPCTALSTARVPRIMTSGTPSGTETIYVGNLFYGSAKDITVNIPPQTYTAMFTSAGALIAGTNNGYDWINDCTLGTTSNYGFVCTFKPGFFTSPNVPVCTLGSGVDATATQQFGFISKTSTGFTLRSATNARFGFEITCTPTGTDVQKAVLAVNDLDYAPRPFTPTFTNLGTYTPPTGMACTEARVGIYNKINCTVLTTGIGANAAFSMALPHGRVAGQMESANRRVGTVTKDKGGAAYPRDWSINTSSGSTTVNVGYLYGGTSASGPFNSGFGNALNDASGTTLQFQFEVPIQGWGPSQGALVKVEQAKVLAVNTSAQSIPNNTFTNITGWTEVTDSHNFFNPSTGVFSPTNGSWWCDVAGQTTVGTNASGKQELQVVGALGSVGNVPFSASDWSLPQVRISGKVDAGQNIRLSMLQNSGSAKTLQGNGSWNNMSITCTPYN